MIHVFSAGQTAAFLMFERKLKLDQWQEPAARIKV
jgi:hypothetical protein